MFISYVVYNLRQSIIHVCCQYFREHGPMGLGMLESKHGPVVQNIVSLTRSLVVIKILTALLTIISNIDIFAEKNMCKSYSHFSAKILVYMPYLMTKVLTIC